MSIPDNHITKEEFNRRLDELETIILNGISCVWVWKVLMVEDEESAEALNRYRGFFLLARNNLLRSALLEFAKVFDRDSRTVSLRNLLAEARKDSETLAPYSSVEELDNIAVQLNELEEFLERLKSHRDQRMAHHDAIIATDNKELLYGEVKKLVDETMSMYNVLSKGHGRLPTSVNRLRMEAQSHTSSVVQLMREDRERAQQRFEDTSTS